MIYVVQLQNGWFGVGVPLEWFQYRYSAKLFPKTDQRSEVLAWARQTLGEPISSLLTERYICMPHLLTGWTQWMPTPRGALFQNRAFGFMTIFDTASLALLMIRFDVTRLDKPVIAR